MCDANVWKIEAGLVQNQNLTLGVAYPSIWAHQHLGVGHERHVCWLMMALKQCSECFDKRRQRHDCSKGLGRLWEWRGAALQLMIVAQACTSKTPQRNPEMRR